MIDHGGVQVSDVEASLAFYLGAFGPVGMREAMRFPVGDSFVVGLSGPSGIPDFWLSPAFGAEARELHIGFQAPGREAVEAGSTRLPSHGGRRYCTRRGSGPSTTRATTQCSCGTSTATTWRRCTMGSEAVAAFPASHKPVVPGQAPFRAC